MNENLQVRAQSSNAVVLAVVTVLALLVAPICAPLCAANACSSAGGRQVQCHDMARFSTDASEQLAAPSKFCGAADFSAVLVRADEKSPVLERVRNAPASIGIIGVRSERVGSLAAASEHLSLHRVSLELSNSLLLTTILRI
jgi:hypothetical protein